jgi:hypothetical protein
VQIPWLSVCIDAELPQSDAVPGLAAVLPAIRVNGLVFDHIILTLYEEQTDYIGRHQDKLRDITPGSDIVSISLGASREFELYRNEVPTHVDGGRLRTGPRDKQNHEACSAATSARYSPGTPHQHCRQTHCNNNDSRAVA